MSRNAATPKKVGTLPVAGSDEQKRTNEIGMAIPLLTTCDIAGKDITGDALLTQRRLAAYVVEQQADYHFPVKRNQPTLERDIALLFETRSIWRGTALIPACWAGLSDRARIHQQKDRREEP